MKTDIDQLMHERNLDALLVVGPGQHNPPMVYLTGGAHLTQALLVKPRGEPATLFFRPMERDEAAKSGLRTRDLSDFQAAPAAAAGRPAALHPGEIYQRILSDLGITRGRAAIYGRMDAGQSYAIFSSLQTAAPDLTLVDEGSDPLLLAAMATKDEGEVARIRRMGQITTQVVARTADLLTSRRVKDDILLAPDGEALTIGMVKNQINLWLAELGAENPEGTIFAQGRDAGVPHSTGDNQAPLRLGQTIVFDIFPCETGGGYYYDFTRTWCLGYAPDEALALYEDVLSVFKQVRSEFKANEPCSQYQELTCKLFQQQGHSTTLESPRTQEGYVHSLGHGVGLNLHENPYFRLSPDGGERLRPGTVITHEPGLYYPERGLGVRLEDTLWVRPDGQVETLAEYPLDLVLPIRQK